MYLVHAATASLGLDGTVVDVAGGFVVVVTVFPEPDVPSEHAESSRATTQHEEKRRRTMTAWIVTRELLRISRESMPTQPSCALTQ